LRYTIAIQFAVKTFNELKHSDDGTASVLDNLSFRTPIFEQCSQMARALKNAPAYQER